MHTKKIRSVSFFGFDLCDLEPWSKSKILKNRLFEEAKSIRGTTDKNIIFCTHIVLHLDLYICKNWVCKKFRFCFMIKLNLLKIP